MATTVDPNTLAPQPAVAAPQPAAAATSGAPPAAGTTQRPMRPMRPMPLRGAQVGANGASSAAPAPLPATLPATAPAAAAAPLPNVQGVHFTPTNPTQDLRSQTILPGAGTDRYAIAQQQFQNSAQASAPAYEKALRDATSAAAGAGRLGSGMLRTSYGDLANQRNQQLQTAQSGFLTDALNNSINDSYTNLGIAQQQQQYQTAAQNQSFGQHLSLEQLQAALQGQQFNQGVTSQQLQNATQGQQFTQGLQQQELQNATQNQAFGQNLATQQLGTQTQAQQFGQGMSLADLQNRMQAQQFGQGVTSQQLQNATQGQQFSQGVQSAELQNALQNQLFGQGITSQQLANQTQQQQFGQGVTQAQLQDQLTSSASNRSLQQLLAGSSGNPADTQLALSQLFGNQASAAGQSLAGLISNTTAKNSATSRTNWLQQLMQSLGLDGSGTTTPETPAIPDSAFGY